MGVHLELVSGCNESCRTCLAGTKEVTPMSEDVLERALKALDPANELILYGLGETFLHPRIGDVLEHIKLKGFENTVIKSNGTAPLGNYLAALGKLKRLYICIDSLDQKVHSRTRSSSMATVCATLERLAVEDHKGTNLGIYSLIHALNYREAPAITAFARSLGMRHWMNPYLPIVVGKTGIVYDDLMMTEDQISEFLRPYLAVNGVTVKHSHIGFNGIENAGYSIGADGAIHRCIGDDVQCDATERDCNICAIGSINKTYNLPPDIIFDPLQAGYFEKTISACRLDRHHGDSS